MKIRSYANYVRHNRSHIACIFRNGLVEQLDNGEIIHRAHCVVGEVEQVFRYLFNTPITPVFPAVVIRYKNDKAQIADELITYDPDYAPDLKLVPWKDEHIGKYLQDLRDEYDKQLEAGLTTPYDSVEGIRYFF